jgi:PmbA protein
MVATGQDGSEKREGIWSSSGVKASEFDPENIGKLAGEMAVQSLKGSVIKEDDYELILQPPAATPVVSTLASCTNPSVQEAELPLLRDRLGEKVASDLFTLHMNPRKLGFAMAGIYDDEGVPTKELTLFEKGVYKASPYDTWYAQKEDVTPTGSGFRGIMHATGGTQYPGKMYHTEPVPATVCLDMEGTSKTFDDIVRSTDKGLIVGYLHYAGVIVRTRGDYTGVARMGSRLVKNGEIVGAVQKCRLVDNILHMASRIEMVGKPVTECYWSTTSSNIPPIKISKAHLMPYYE